MHIVPWSKRFFNDNAEYIHNNSIQKLYIITDDKQYGILTAYCIYWNPLSSDP